MATSPAVNYQDLVEKIKLWATELGFSQVGISDIDLEKHQDYLDDWLAKGYHGNMDYMARHGDMRSHPDKLHPGTIRVISVRMNYLPANARFAATLKDSTLAYVSRYALGRDYHKLMRNRLKQLGEKIKLECQQLDYRPFVDSAPILERPLAQKAGIGWVGKHTLTINEQQGSWFFLGELLVDIPLPVSQEATNQCGSCVACMTICPTQAITAPYVVDARRCISYLTIEHQGSIPTALRPLLGNRIYGCDDCQLICPWNRYGQLTKENDFLPRQQLDNISLLELFAWNESEFLDKTQGSPIRRIGFENWQRNLAIALGNAAGDPQIIAALTTKFSTSSELVKEHIQWAVEQQQARLSQQEEYSLSRQTSRLIRTIEKGLSRDS
jgi:epoxyqueuosine reductase